MEKNKYIAIKGAYGERNFGDDALLLTVHMIVSETLSPEKVIVVCRKADYLRRFLPDVHVVEPNEIQKNSVDFLVYGGGTQFFHFPTNSVDNSLRSLIRKGKLLLRWGKELVLQAFKKNDKAIARKVIAIGIGVGPLQSDAVYAHRIRRLFASMEYVAVRDNLSYELCSQWGCNDIELVSDLCFWPKFRNLYMSEIDISGRNKIDKIGVIVRDWGYSDQGDSYALPLLSVINDLRHKGKEIQFILFADNKDCKWVERLESLGENIKVWNPDVDDIPSFLKYLSHFDSFITARYHGAVFSSLLGKPVLCINIEQKLRMICELLGAGAELWSYPFNAGECIEKIEYLEKHNIFAKKELKKIVNQQGLRLDSMVKKMGDLYGAK